MDTGAQPIEWHMYNELVKAVKTAGVKNIYLENRSKKMDGVSEFVIVSIPATIYDMMKGTDDAIKTTTGILYLGEKAKTDNTPNIASQTEFVRKIKALFPISDTHIEAVKPLVQFEGDDGSSFQMTTITFTLRTKFNSYLK